MSQFRKLSRLITELAKLACPLLAPARHSRSRRNQQQRREAVRLNRDEREARAVARMGPLHPENLLGGLARRHRKALTLLAAELGEGYAAASREMASKACVARLREQRAQRLLRAADALQDWKRWESDMNRRSG